MLLRVYVQIWKGGLECVWWEYVFVAQRRKAARFRRESGSWPAA